MFTKTVTALALAATLGTPLAASADSTRVYAAPAISKAMTPCQVEPCNTGLPDLSRKHGRMVAPAIAPAAGTGFGTTHDVQGSFRWPWQKKKTKDRLKCC